VLKRFISSAGFVKDKACMVAKKKNLGPIIISKFQNCGVLCMAF